MARDDQLNIRSSYTQLPNGRTCDLTGCDRKYYGLGLCHPHYQQNYRRRHPDRTRAWQRQASERYYREPDNSLKIRARRELGTEVRAGRIIPPESCSQCHTVGPVEGHHPDYTRSLEVIWLCTSCHDEQDRRERTV